MGITELKEFNFTFVKHCDYNPKLTDIKRLKRIKSQKVSLPHDIAFSVSEFKDENQLYYAQNILELQKYEDIDSFYYTQFDSDLKVAELLVNRVDLFSEIYLNGEQVLKTDNAFISFSTIVKLKKHNSLVIHILPCMLEAKKYDASPTMFSLRYNGACHYLRRPQYSFGWDIFPRNVLGGIFDSVKFISVKENKIKQTYFYTSLIDAQNKTANINVSCSVCLSDDDYSKYSIEILGECEDSSFNFKGRVWSTIFCEKFTVKNCKFWNVKNCGKQYLYKLSIKLFYNDVLVDEYIQNVGIRTIRLDRTSFCDENGGKFDFIVNGERIFVLGTNWVPADAFGSVAEKRLDKTLKELDDSGCNMVRVWGGGIYEPDRFYEFCDEHGILVWQDFMMACAYYPIDDCFIKNLENEVASVLIRLRNHPSIAIWAGDNECDSFRVCHNVLFNPNDNVITRQVIVKQMFKHGLGHIYLPSSPYYDENVYRTLKEPSENHCWGPRNYFKSEYYDNISCAFISEIGYMGIPQYDSLTKFICNDAINNFESDDYLVHASSPTVENSYYKFRIGLNLQPIMDTFGTVPKDINDIIKCSQITEAEALKFFIERMRAHKDKTGGIIWWNLIDGWPQLSDSVIDYYYNKKLAYYYVKNSQQYIDFIMDQKGETVSLYAVNDTLEDKDIDYFVKNVESSTVIYQGKLSLKKNSVVKLDSFVDKNRTCYEMKWIFDGKEFYNHFISNIKGISLNEYETLIYKTNVNIGGILNEKNH